VRLRSRFLSREHERLIVDVVDRQNPQMRLRDPIFPAIFFFDVGETHSVSDCLPREEFYRTRFSKEWLAPQELVDGLFSNLEKSPTSCAIFTVARRIIDGLVDDEMRRRYELVVPHMRRALLIGQVIDLNKVEAAAFADSLDTLSAGMILVDAVHSPPNQAASNQ